MRRLILLFCIITGSFADLYSDPDSCLVDTICHEKVRSIKRLQSITFIPKDAEQLITLRKLFKINDYFPILKNISIEQNWKLDFIYCRESAGSSPIIVAYQNADDYAAMSEKYKKKYQSWHTYTNEEYWMHIVLNRTKESYFEYVILSILGSQFSLFWHGLYNDIVIICTKDELMKRFNKLMLDKRFIKKAKAELIDPTPSVVIGDKQAIVRIVVFTEWGGFIERKYYINTHFPHKISKIKEKVLVKYDCGFLY